MTKEIVGLQRVVEGNGIESRDGYKGKAALAYWSLRDEKMKELNSHNQVTSQVGELGGNC